MENPRYTVIVPMAHFRLDEPVLVGLRAIPAPPSGMEVIVAEGGHPARQRNAALEQARGEILVFLDNDCAIAPDFWTELDAVFVRPEVEIVGGPARLGSDATGWEKIFHALLTHTLIVGTVSARYAPRGKFRDATQTDLILCNLAVRRSIFDKIGPLSSRLYPNEENEWLDRAHAAKAGAYYDPALQVYRPQRAAPGAMALTLLRYGMGRTRQFWVSGWKPTFHQVLPVMFLATLVVLIHWRLELPFVTLWLVASTIIGVTCEAGLSLGQRVAAGLIGPLVPLIYAIGQVMGWFALFLPPPKVTTEIVLLNERGERLVTQKIVGEKR